VKVYVDLYGPQLKAVKDYIGDVQSGSFPADEHSFGMKAEALSELRRALKR
jgi:ketopantoate hydroxymethyltransferase